MAVASLHHFLMNNEMLCGFVRKPASSHAHVSPILSRRTASHLMPYLIILTLALICAMIKLTKLVPMKVKPSKAALGNGRSTDHDVSPILSPAQAAEPACPFGALQLSVTAGASRDKQ